MGSDGCGGSIGRPSRLESEGEVGLSVITAWLLGVIQGLTEFLPVSSSGHLVLGGVALGLTESHLLFDIVLHVATLLATLVFYRDAVTAIVKETLSALRAGLVERSVSAGLAGRPAARFAMLIVLGCIPTAVIGVVFKDQLEALFVAPRAAAAMLLATAAMLMGTRFVRPGRLQVEGIRVTDALLIGLVQGFAIIPGVSRSGSTIACALFLGIDRELAARFSFLLSVPAIVGALVLKLADGGAHWSGGALTLVVGFVTAALVGLGALAILIPLVRGGRFYYFAFYLIPVSVAALIWLP